MIKANLEKDVFLYGLLIGIGYQLYQTFLCLVPHLLPELALLNIFITLLLFFFFLIAQKKGAHPLLVLSVHLVALSGFTYFWINYGGMAGTVPDFYCAYIAFTVICSHGIWRWLLIGSSFLLIFFYFYFFQWLGMSSIWEEFKTDPVQQAVDYLIIGGVFAVFILSMKRKFFHYRESVAHRYKQLDQIARTLAQQNQELAMRQEETRSINENLEALIENRTREVETKNNNLSEYAFINAHMLRGPLCRIMGVINLMEKEPHLYPPHQLNQLKALTQEIDHHVKEINSVISY